MFKQYKEIFYNEEKVLYPKSKEYFYEKYA